MENNKKTNIISQVSRFQDFMGSAEAYIKPIRTCIRTCKMELFEKIANGFQMILDARLGSAYAPGLYANLLYKLCNYQTILTFVIFSPFLRSTVKSKNGPNEICDRQSFKKFE